jgi:hypothetical protein
MVELRNGYWTPLEQPHEVPYPKTITLGANQMEGLWKLNARSIQFEFHPYEFGSWDSGVAAFAWSKYLGTVIRGGKPINSGCCIQNFDNLGHIFGMRSNLFDELCVGLGDIFAGVGSRFLTWRLLRVLLRNQPIEL